MEKLYYIQDVETKEYYWEYRIDSGFGDLEDAKSFDNIESIEEILTSDWLEDLFCGRIIEIKLYYKIKE